MPCSLHLHRLGTTNTGPLIAWLNYLAQGSQDTTVSGEFQSVALAASVVAVWRVVCLVPTENGTITDALDAVTHFKNPDEFLFAFVEEACDSLYLDFRLSSPLVGR